MSLITGIQALAAAIAAQINTINTNAGALASLTTTQKASLVGAINELDAAIDALDLTSIIDDVATTGAAKTYSIDKIKVLIAAAKSELVNGAGSAYDTLSELATALTNNDGDITTILTAQAKRVAVDAVQTFTEGEKTQARSNIGVYGTAEIGDPATDLAAYFATQLT
jgi:hypothetical protein